MKSFRPFCPVQRPSGPLLPRRARSAAANAAGAGRSSPSRFEDRDFEAGGGCREERSSPIRFARRSPPKPDAGDAARRTPDGSPSTTSDRGLRDLEAPTLDPSPSRPSAPRRRTPTTPSPNRPPTPLAPDSVGLRLPCRPSPRPLRHPPGPRRRAPHSPGPPRSREHRTVLDLPSAAVPEIPSGFDRPPRGAGRETPYPSDPRMSSTHSSGERAEVSRRSSGRSGGS